MELIEKLKNKFSYDPNAEIQQNVFNPLEGSTNLEGPTQVNRGAVLLLLYQKGGDFYFPLIQRPVYNGVHSGQIALPGGRAEPDDLNLYETALRETNEEIGVESSTVEIIGGMEQVFISVSNYLVLPAVGFCKATPDFIPDAYEVEKVIEAPLKELLNQQRSKKIEIEVSQGYNVKSSYFDIQGHVVWGATARMLHEFVEIIDSL